MRTFSITGVMQQKATTLLARADCSRNNAPPSRGIIVNAIAGMRRSAAAYDSTLRSSFFLRIDERIDGTRRREQAIVKKATPGKGSDDDNQDSVGDDGH